MARLLDDVKLVTCAGPCGQPLVPPSEFEFANGLNPKARKHLPEKFMAARINDRPFCEECRKAVGYTRTRV